MDNDPYQSPVDAVQSYTVVRRTWLSRRLDARAFYVALLSTGGVIIASLMYWFNSWGASEWMSATADQVFGAHQVWRAWTTLLVHADVRHLLSNCLLFFVFGIFLSGYFGPWVFPALAIFTGGLVNLAVLHSLPGPVELIGISGVVFWMGGFWLILYFFLDRRRSPIQRFLRSLGVALVLFGPGEVFDPSVSYMSHALGFAAGVVLGGAYFLLCRRHFLNNEVVETVVEGAAVDL